MVILIAILVGIPLGFLLEALFLHWTAKIFKVENANYKTALRISIYFWLMAIVVAIIIGILLSAIKIELISNIVAIIAGFFIANFLYKKYYQTDTKKNIKIYIVKMLLSGVVSFFFAIAVFVPIRVYVFQPFYVQGAAMEPNFHDGQYMFIKIYDKSYQRGDVVVHKYPKDTTKYFIKRIIGLPGEKIEIRNNAVYVNGNILNESAYLGADVETAGDINITLAGDECFVMGDNRSGSSDSRAWGPLKKNLIIGKYWITPFGK